MLVSTKQAYIFRQELGISPIDGTAIIGEKFTLPLTEAPVEAPEWIKETQLWKLAMKDGTIIDFGVSRGISVVI